MVSCGRHSDAHPRSGTLQRCDSPICRTVRGLFRRGQGGGGASRVYQHVGAERHPRAYGAGDTWRGGHRQSEGTGSECTGLRHQRHHRRERAGHGGVPPGCAVEDVTRRPHPLYPVAAHGETVEDRQQHGLRGTVHTEPADEPLLHPRPEHHHAPRPCHLPHEQQPAGTGDGYHRDVLRAPGAEAHPAH